MTRLVRPWMPCAALTVIVATLAAAHALRRPTADAAPVRPAAQTPAADQTVYDFALLNPSAAAALHGKTARFRVVLDSSADRRLGRVCYDCVTPDDRERTVYFRPGQGEENEMVVEARFMVLYHPARQASDGTAFEDFAEYRLMDAVRARP